MKASLIEPFGCLSRHVVLVRVAVIKGSGRWRVGNQEGGRLGEECFHFLSVSYNIHTSKYYHTFCARLKSITAEENEDDVLYEHIEFEQNRKRRSG